MKAILLAISLCLGASLSAQDLTPGAQPPSAPLEAVKAKPRVKIDTSYGPFVVELEPDLAPKTVANFLRYVQEGFYSDTIFHRVISSFMIQGGGLTADMTEKPTHDAIANEAGATAKAGLLNTKGTIAMARQDKVTSATAQFYINTADNESLDHKNETEAGFGYCAFGRVVSGMDVVMKIEQVRTGWHRGQQNVPEIPLRIKSAKLLPALP